MKYYILSGVYNDPMPVTPDEMKELMPGHIRFVQDGVDAGNVLFGGPRANGSSGMIIVRAENEDALNAYIATDPLFVKGVQHYDITEVLPMEHQSFIEPWLI
ncbi:MAG: hypothetical protein HUJ65_06210 [Oscillospiraceae bacterium]|nr:hypothetical protein [Oscillospiraceae bacterium]